jgi:hypothetical protein
MTDKPLCKAFVSSTYIDLKEHRGRVMTNGTVEHGIMVFGAKWVATYLA